MSTVEILAFQLARTLSVDVLLSFLSSKQPCFIGQWLGNVVCVRTVAKLKHLVTSCKSFDFRVKAGINLKFCKKKPEPLFLLEFQSQGIDVLP